MLRGSAWELVTNSPGRDCSILPTYSKDIPFAEVQDTDFRSATKLTKQKLDETVEKLDVNALYFDPGDSKTAENQGKELSSSN